MLGAKAGLFAAIVVLGMVAECYGQGRVFTCSWSFAQSPVGMPGGGGLSVKGVVWFAS